MFSSTAAVPPRRQCGTLLAFHSYLTERKQMKKDECNVLPLFYGVDQGSIIGPILFLSLINHLASFLPYGLAMTHLRHQQLLRHSQQLICSQFNACLEIWWIRFSKNVVCRATLGQTVFREYFANFLKIRPVDGNIDRTLVMTISTAGHRMLHDRRHFKRLCNTTNSVRWTEKDFLVHFPPV